MLNYLVEFGGTLIFIFIILYTGNFLAIGATLTALIYLGGPISGGAFNPAVALALYLKKKLSLQDTVIYCILQLIAAISAFYLLKLIK